MNLENVTDIHSHLLFGVDDGAKSPEESLETLRLARAEGIGCVVATPHYGIENGYAPEPRAVKAAFEAVKARVAAEIPGMRLYLGSEVLCVPGETLRRVEAGRAFPMNGTRYLLLEFIEYGGFHESVETIHENLAGIARAGYLPILAHAQRYRAFSGQWAAYRSLVEAGVYLQINAYDLEERGADEVRDITRWLAQNRLAHFIGTDSHGVHKRPPRMRSGARYLYEHCDAAYVEALLRGNAETMLAGGVVALG